MTFNDISSVCELESVLNTTPWQFSEFERALHNPRHICLVMEKKYQILGYCILSTILDESELLIIGVAPSMQGQGYASNLLHTAIVRLEEKKCCELFLEVRSKNNTAIKLYEKFAFEPVGIRKAYYGDDDALLYKLLL